MDLNGIQAAIREQGIDGWLFYDFHHRDPLSYRILGLDIDKMTSRRWFYFVPAEGTPQKLAHSVEPGRIDALPGDKTVYRAWTELQSELERILAGAGKVAMQYSPMNRIPYISLVDAGTVELVRACGAEVVSSADLVQQFEAVLDDAAIASHHEAGAFVQQVKDDAYARMDAALKSGQSLTEHEIAQGIIEAFTAGGYETESVPIVGFNDHAADPHFEPTEANAHTLKRGDMILLDLWARKKEPTGVYYDVTWCGYAGDDPPEQYLKIWKLACDARDAGLQLVRERMAAGAPLKGAEVDDAVRDVIVAGGYGDWFVHRTGHNISRDLHGNGVNIDNLETEDTRSIVPGICFSIEPGIYLTGKMGVRTEIDVVVTPAGEVEVAGPIQRDLIRVG